MSKILTYTVMIFLLVMACYSHISYGDVVIKNKVLGYDEVREASLWLKDNSNPEDLVYSQSRPYFTYYAERYTKSVHRDFDIYLMGEEEFVAEIKELEADFLMLSIYEPHPEWMMDFPGRYNLSLLFVIPDRVLIYSLSPLLNK